MVRGSKDRLSLRLQGYDYSRPGAYFVTMCTRNRMPVFGRIDDGEMRLNECGSIVKNIWKEIPIHFTNTTLDEFIVMPNHVHGSFFWTKPQIVGARHAVPLRPKDLENQ